MIYEHILYFTTTSYLPPHPNLRTPILSSPWVWLPPAVFCFHPPVVSATPWRMGGGKSVCVCLCVCVSVCLCCSVVVLRLTWHPHHMQGGEVGGAFKLFLALGYPQSALENDCLLLLRYSKAVVNLYTNLCVRKFLSVRASACAHGRVYAHACVCMYSSNMVVNMVYFSNMQICKFLSRASQGIPYLSGWSHLITR